MKLSFGELGISQSVATGESEDTKIRTGGE
jgi:hypothetical protein